jgi:hypothetical protein
MLICTGYSNLKKRYISLKRLIHQLDYSKLKQYFFHHTNRGKLNRSEPTLTQNIVVHAEKKINASDGALHIFVPGSWNRLAQSMCMLLQLAPLAPNYNRVHGIMVGLKEK